MNPFRPTAVRGWSRKVPTIPGINTPREVRADFPATPASAGQARRFVDSTLRSWGCELLIDIATLLTSELVSNAILHARTTIRVVIGNQDDRVRVEVHDGDFGTPARKHYSSMSTTGRGLMLVERLSDDWGVTGSSTGKSVWFELSRVSAESRSGAELFDHAAFDFDVEDAVGGGASREHSLRPAGRGRSPWDLVEAGRG